MEINRTPMPAMGTFDKELHPHLPPIPGPKMQPFDLEAQPNIRFIERIDTGGHAYVFKVLINDKIYALKVFIFRDREEMDLGLCMFADEEELKKGTGLDFRQMIYESEPFYCECRAYGRLCEAGREDMAVPCHGYVKLDATVEKQLVQDFDCDFRRRPYHTLSGPVRALVKEYVDTNINFTADMIPVMQTNLRELHRLGMIHKDIKEANYMNNLFVDFSTTWTVPHTSMDGNDADKRHNTEWAAWSDCAELDNMLDDWNAGHEEDKIVFHRLWDDKFGTNPGDVPMNYGWLLKYNPLDYAWRPTVPTMASAGAGEAEEII